MGSGDPGPRGVAGPSGENGISSARFYMRTTGPTPPTRPAITYRVSGGLGTFANLDTWSPTVPPAATGNTNPYIWFVVVNYTINTQGQTVSFPQAWNAVPGYSYQNFYLASTANTMAAPSITYAYNSGTQAWEFGGLGSWTTTIPTTPEGANLFVVPVRYRLNLMGQTVDGIARLGTIPAAVSPPVQTSYTMSYGLVSGSPSYTTSDTATTSAITLASGDTGYFDFRSPNTTSASPNVYFDLPAGLTLVNVQQRQAGQYFINPSGWTTDDSSQPRRYINDSNRENTFVIVRVNVRRP